MGYRGQRVGGADALQLGQGCMPTVHVSVKRECAPAVRVMMMKGEKGEKGDQGEKGEPGVSGNYDELTNLPAINGNTLMGDQSLDDLDVYALTNMEIEEMFRNM